MVSGHGYNFRESVGLSFPVASLSRSSARFRLPRGKGQRKTAFFGGSPGTDEDPAILRFPPCAHFALVDERHTATVVVCGVDPDASKDSTAVRFVKSATVAIKSMCNAARTSGSARSLCTS